MGKPRRNWERGSVCVWTLLFNPEMLGSLQKGSLLREEQPRLGSAALHSLHRVRNGVRDIQGTLEQGAGFQLSLSQKREKVLLGIRSLGKPC